MDEADDGPPYEPDDIRSLYEEEHPGGWAAARLERDERERRERELLARSPWRRLERRIEQLAHDAGIESDLARRVVLDRLAGEIAETVVGEFRREIGLDGPVPPQADGNSPVGRIDDPKVETPYLDVQQAAAYLRKSPKAIYGLIERGKLRKMPGSRVCYFTRELLDDFLRGETHHGRGVRPGRRPKG